MQQPSFLQKGDTVGIIALASKVNFDDLKPAITLLEKEWGLHVCLGESLQGSFHQYAATDAVRANDFQTMLDNPQIKAIFSARGGYGSARIIDRIDFARFVETPKWIIGFSDITAVLCHLHTLGFESIHGVMPKLFLQEGGAESLETLRKTLFGQSLFYKIPTHPLNRQGIAQGQLLGGNLTLLAHILGSKSEVDTQGKILFIEDIGEYLYAIDRLLIQLKRAGKLTHLAGLIVGSFSDLHDHDTPYGASVDEIVAEAVADYDYPVCYGFPVGHDANNWALPIGRNVRLQVQSTGVSLMEDKQLSINAE